MFKVKKNGSKKEYIVYAAQEYKMNGSGYETQFLIYKKKDWEWVDADDYEPVKTDDNSKRLSKLNVDKHCLWEYGVNYHFIKSKCDFTMDTHRINPYEFKYCPSCGKKIKIKEM